MEDYTISEGYELPSKGLVYDKDVNPHVELRSMTVRDEMKLLSPSTNEYKKISEIIDGCMVGKKPGISTYDMVIGDYEYLLHKLRIVTYGSDYKMVVGCPHCDSVHEEVINLEDLQVFDFDIDEFNKLKTFTLPVCQKIITLKPKTPRMIDESVIMVKDFKKAHKEITYKPEPLIETILVIDTVDGNKLSYSQLEDFVMNLSAKDRLYIAQKSMKLTNMVGINARVDVTCSKCGEDISTFFRSGPEFFTPTLD